MLNITLTFDTCICRKVNGTEGSRVLCSRENPNADISECLLVGRINSNRVTSVAVQYLNISQAIHMEKYMR